VGYGPMRTKVDKGRGSIFTVFLWTSFIDDHLYIPFGVLSHRWLGDRKGIQPVKHLPPETVSSSDKSDVLYLLTLRVPARYVLQEMANTLSGNVPGQKQRENLQ